ncbi:helix-turn-helix domain-containing protein [Nonomuraea sp. NPDC050153]|uniref:helix-turn-helix domain-containing protein n=1 Tax=Nonomuraea sp. NPDC050153 TaxID=3364359 RepID=UPI0037A51DD8
MTNPTPGLPLHQRAEYERARRGLTKEQLAKKTGLSRVTYDRIATQANPPYADTVRKLCEALGIPLAEGLRLAGVAPDAAASQPTVEALLVAELSRRLPDVDQDTLARVLEHTADILQGAAVVLAETPEGTAP